MSKSGIHHFCHTFTKIKGDQSRGKDGKVREFKSGHGKVGENGKN